MALVTTTGSLLRQYNAFTGLSATERSQSGIARAEVVYYNVNDSWPVPGSGNNRIYTTGNIELPKDFGYVLTDAYCRIDGAAAPNISAASVIRMFPGGILGPQINATLSSISDRQDGAGSTAIGNIAANAYNAIFLGDFAQIHQLESKPSAILYPFGSNSYTSASNPGTLWNWTIGEELNSGDAYDVSVYFRFLQYDIDQSYNYVIQSPQLTR
jgi:hypothetical protein